MTRPTLVPATTPLSWIKPLSWDPKMRSEKRTKNQHPEQGPPQFLQCACEVNEPAHILLGDDLFGRHAAKKKRAMWTPKWCLKSGPRFGAREKKKQFGGPRNGVQILHPILGSTLPIIFREVTPEKLTF